MSVYFRKKTTGMTLVELLVAIALLMLVFGGIFTAFQTILKLVGSSKAHAGALALANEKIEYIRSLPYDDVGTVSGIPNGAIPQTSTTTLNGIDYTERVLIEYIDDPHDGTDVADDNSIVADYKRAKVEYSWVEQSGSKVIALISNIIPPGIETTAGGGTVRVNVFDATAQPLAGASVRLFNDTGTTTIDVTRNTNASGVALFSGAPALANYQITVTDTGYSTDQTYSATTSNPNPTTSHVAVLEAEVSTMNFQIDELSNLTIYTKDVATAGTFSDSFSDSSLVTATSGTQIISDRVLLEGSPGSFSSFGTLFSTTITPTPLLTWDNLTIESVVPADTTLRVRVYEVTGTSTRTLVPDTDLPGNSVGFISGTILLSSIDTSTYPSLSLGATLTSSSTATSSELRAWSVGYTEDQSPIPNIGFTLTSSKTIGTNLDSSPVYKNSTTATTDGGGQREITNLEWDAYTVAVTNPAYDIAEACENIPYVLNPGVAEDLVLSLVPDVAYSNRIVVVDITGAYIPNASVRLQRPGFDETKITGNCGQVFFGSGLGAYADYEVAVSATGYSTQSINPIEIADDEVLVVTLNAS